MSLSVFNFLFSRFGKMENLMWMSAQYSETMCYLAKVFAGVLGVSRSDVLRFALEEYLTRHLTELAEDLKDKNIAKGLVEQ